MNLVVGMFERDEDASRAVNQLNSLNIDTGDIHVMTRRQVEQADNSLLASLAGAFSAGDTPLSKRLTSLGLTPDEADYYDQELGEESILVAVEVEAELEDQASQAMQDANGVMRT